MRDLRYYVVELNAQNRELRGDFANEDVLTLPIVDGPYDSPEVAAENANPAHWQSVDGYGVVSIHPDQEPDEEVSLE